MNPKRYTFEAEIKKVPGIIALGTMLILLDGEFGDKPWYSIFGFTAAALLLAGGIIQYMDLS